MHGDLIPGPFAYAFPRCGVMDNHGGTPGMIQRQRDLNDGTVIDAEIGDLIEVEGLFFEIRNGGEIGYHNAQRGGGCVHGPDCRDHIALLLVDLRITETC